MQKKLVHQAFEIGITVKFIDGVLEVIGGFLVVWVHPSSVARWISHLTQHELVTSWAHHLTSYSQGFAAFYLFSHGIVKIFIVICLWMKRLWAYPMAIGFFVAFGIYQTHLYLLTHSTLMLVLTIWDVVIIWLTWLEYQNVKLKMHDPSA